MVFVLDVKTGSNYFKIRQVRFVNVSVFTLAKHAHKLRVYHARQTLLW